MPDVFYRFYHRSEKNACPDLNGLCPRPSIDVHDMKQHLMLYTQLVGVTLYRPHNMKGKKIVIGVLRNYGDQDSLSTFTEPRSPPDDITNVGIRFFLKLYGAVRSTLLDKLRYSLYTRSVSRSSLSSRFKLESLLPTAAAAKNPFIPCLYCSGTIIDRAKTTTRRWATLTTHSQSSATVVNRKLWLLCCWLLDEPCSLEDLTIVTERAKACARMWQHLV